MQWSLVEERLSRRIAKIYDDGEGAEWLESYADAGPPEALRFLGATRSGRVQGIATWTVTDWNDTLWLVDIRVRAENRGTGVGTALIGGLLDESRRTSLRGIFVETQIRNYPAVCFYRRRGFEISGFNDHLYTNHDLDEGDVALYLFREA
jgi:GNAT superfamily N-acetyltransferase